MCIEMLPFAIGHWVAFTYKDYATSSMIGFARLPVYYAIRDALGTVDLVIDFMSTFYGSSYGYRQFDSVEAILDHPESASRRARIMAGLRYKNGGRSKYWLPQKKTPKYSALSPKPSGDTSTSLMTDSVRSYGGVYDTNSSYEPSIGSSDSEVADLEAQNDAPQSLELPDQDLQGDESIYTQAKRLRYGDYNYPVITVRESIQYTPVIDRQLARGTSTTLAEEYESFAGPNDSDNESTDAFP
ncbi:hypothetical protein AWJ20_4302 [Sugiyamaella lignohabitans]|uniref:Uncharacterized protein n=1 Tax=Sugiyamaella lignohabitans TaxID=796027 RepID=A0A167CC46_9ASCO|nr:uncharacterized protein AWJ20_4302 [Sugiyamaella lignohabitans]ANB11490.1 hypothetical protein AWJ20_4302 [Sugiyamaella lignohabitans]